MLVSSLLGLDQRVVLLSAPAGYGKTIALSQWLAAYPRPASWLYLEADDDDPVVLLTYLALALAAVAPVDDELLELLRLPAPPLNERVLPSLATALATAPPFLLVLEDCELMTGDHSWAMVEFLAEHLPPGGQLALSSRTDPPLPLPRWRAAGELAEIRAERLAFDRGEIASLLAEHEIDADEETLDALTAVTGGWPVAVYLSMLAARDARPEELPGRLRANGRGIEEYFVAEVLDREPADVQEFLLRSAILDPLEPGPVQAVTGRVDAPGLLAGLARANLFVSADEEPYEIYRYQELFADLLRTELQRRHPGEKARLHAVAAAWFQEHGDLDQTIRHFVAGGRIDDAADLAASSWPRLWRRGQQETARRWLRAFTDEQVLDRPGLTLAAGWVYSAGADVTLGWRWALAACNVRVGDEPSPDGASSLRSSQLLLRATIAPDGVTRMRADAEEAARLESRPGTSWHVDAQMILGVARWLTGARRRAEHPLELAATQGVVFNQSSELSALGSLALVAIDEGDWARAAEHVARARARLAELGFGTMRRSLPMLFAEALLGAHGGERVGELTADIGLVIDEMVPHPWLVLTGQVLLGEACVTCGDLTVARRWSAQADQTLTTYPDAGILRGRAQRLSQALERAAHGESLTPAERRVLVLLPTHLSEGRIAEELSVSPNTVKTHLRGVYRKLGAANRAEAVERARELGLLKDV